MYATTPNFGVPAEAEKQITVSRAGHLDAHDGIRATCRRRGRWRYDEELNGVFGEGGVIPLHHGKVMIQVMIGFHDFITFYDSIEKKFVCLRRRLKKKKVSF